MLRPTAKVVALTLPLGLLVSAVCLFDQLSMPGGLGRWWSASSEAPMLRMAREVLEKNWTQTDANDCEGPLRTEGEIAARQQNGPMYDLTIQISRFFCNPGVAARSLGSPSCASRRTTGPSSS